MTKRSFLLIPLCALCVLCGSSLSSQAQLFKKKDTAAPQAALAPGQFEWHPERSPSGPLLMVVSIDDQIAYVYRNGILIGQSPVGIRNPRKAIPAGVFLMLEGTEPGENPVVAGKPIRPWATLALDNKPTGDSVADLRERLDIPADFARKIYDLAQPGTILLTTAQASTPETQSATDFTIMRPEVLETP